MTKTDPSFLIDCAAAIAAAPFDQLLHTAEICGIKIRDNGTGGYIATGYGIRAQRSECREKAVQAWGWKVEEAFGRTAATEN